MSAPVGGLHHVGIVVRDLDRAEAFATQALGLPVTGRIASEAHGMRATFLACGPALVELVEFSDPELVERRLGDRTAAIDHIALAVADLDAAVAALGDHGVRTASPEPTAMPSGRFHFTDADTSAGIVWQLLELASPNRE